MTDTLTGHVVAIVGASRGIGRAMALACAAEGARVVLAARNEEALAEVADTIAQRGGEAIRVGCNVTELPQVDALRASAEDRFGPVDLLVNNAGRCNALGPSWEADAGDWWADVTVNLQGVYHGCRAFLPGMIERGAGRIVNLVGGGTRKPFVFASAYGCSKAAVMALTETLSVELAELDVPVRVFALNPGFVRTDMTEQFEKTERGRRWMARLAERLQAGGDISPDYAAQMVVAIGRGRLDSLAGRYLSSERDAHDLEALLAKQADIEAQELRVPRIAL